MRQRLQGNPSPHAESELWLRLGLCLAAQGRQDEASPAFKQAALGEDDEVAVRALMQLIDAEAPAARASELLRRVERRASASTQPSVVVDIASVLLERGNGTQAARLLERVRDEGRAPAPRSEEDPADRRARALATLRLAELRADDADAVEVVDALLQEAIDANDPGVTPLAALRLADRRRARPAQGCAEDDLLRIAWSYDHPQVSSEAGRRLFDLYLERGQRSWAQELLEAFAERGDLATAEWAREQFASTQEALAEEGLRMQEAPPPRQRSLVRQARGLPAGRPHLLHALVVGAGSGGRRLLNEADRRRVRIVGVLDDDCAGKVEGHQVLGRIADLSSVLHEREVDRVWLAIPSAGAQLRYDVAMRCAQAAVSLRVLPNPFELMADRNYVRQLRPLRIEETYGDDGARIAVGQITGAVVRERSVLIVGAGGSIGSELARQVVRGRPRYLALVDRSESSLVELEAELREDLRFKWTFSSTAEAANRREMAAAMQLHRPDVVFVAAGYNHAHMAEANLVQAARVNVLGVWITAQEAVRAGAMRVVLVSSDNAAQRSCPFDWTKAIGERAVVGLEAPGATVCAVRLPNVFRTAGSVIQRFEKQVRTGGAVTVIDAAASRRYLTLHEAAQWLLRVAEIAEPGAVYAVDAGVDVEILELARRIIRLHGLEPERDVPIKLMSPRQGEKQSCSLWGPDEQLVETSLREVVRVVGTPWDLRILQQELSYAETMADPDPAYVRELLRHAAPRIDDTVPVATEQP